MYVCMYVFTIKSNPHTAWRLPLRLLILVIEDISTEISTDGRPEQVAAQTGSEDSTETDTDREKQ